MPCYAMLCHAAQAGGGAEQLIAAADAHKHVARLTPAVSHRCIMSGMPVTCRYLRMWAQLVDPDGFAGPWGLRTAERRSPCYNYSYAHHDCWNGPSWPYETARVLTGAAIA